MVLLAGDQVLGPDLLLLLLLLPATAVPGRVRAAVVARGERARTVRHNLRVRGATADAVLLMVAIVVRVRRRRFRGRREDLAVGADALGQQGQDGNEPGVGGVEGHEPDGEALVDGQVEEVLALVEG